MTRVAVHQLHRAGHGVSGTIAAANARLIEAQARVDMVFGLFSMLGYNFTPRFKDLGDQRFWRGEMPGVASGGYGPLEDLARNRVNPNKVVTHWPDMLRVAGSLVTGQVRAYDPLRMFGRESCPTPMGQAFAEYGRNAKTLHSLRVVDPVDDTLRPLRDPAAGDADEDDEQP